jgi:hypothetical protein
MLRWYGYANLIKSMKGQGLALHLSILDDYNITRSYLSEGSGEMVLPAAGASISFEPKHQGGSGR